MNRIILPSLALVHVRKATRQDLHSMEWGGELVHFRRIFNDAYYHCQIGTGLIWIAEAPVHGLVGQLIISLRSNRTDLSDGKKRAYLYGFRVRPEFRGQGIGTLMMNSIEDDLVRRSYEIITLNVAQENIGAWRLYDSLGYVVVGADEGKWSYLDHNGKRIDVHEPAWRMEKTLQKH